MRVGDLDGVGSFALVGPGFGSGPCRLLTGLRQAGADEPTPLVYAPFEAIGVRPHRLAADEIRSVTVDIETEIPPFEVTLDTAGYHDTIRAIRDAIAAGDVYQVCYTVRAVLGALSGSELLALMCQRGLPRFAAWVRLPWGEEFVSASPELFFETDCRRVHAEPMKGTATRDAAGALDLSEKDRAELAMITDLLRNDLTPVCTPRTVTVECERRTLHLPYAVQTVSDVVGELRPEVSPLDVLAALHPGGSVTGAPKQAALAMIEALETEPRGAYCGTLGVLEGDRAVFSLLIRTAWRQCRAGHASPGRTSWVYGVGGGIVFDSDADRELEELHVKLGALGCRTRC